MYFKFLNKNENVMFGDGVITRAREFISHFINCHKSSGFANRQLSYQNGIFYLVEFEYVVEDDTYYSKIIYTLGEHKLIFRYRDDLMMSVHVLNEQ